MTINPLRSRPPVEISDRKAPTKAQKVAAYNAANARWGNLPDTALFERHIEFDANGGCWLWAGSSGGRYGSAWSRQHGRQIPAHRRSWLLFRGDIPEGLHVCHRCDVTFCVNPAHLFLGTHADNMADKVKKGRQGNIRGSEVSNSLLSEDDVSEIIRLLDAGESYARIAAEYGVIPATIGRIASGQGWGHVSKGVDRKTGRQGEFGSATLTEADVMVIRRRIAEGERVAHVARSYPSVTLSNIYAIAQRRSWRHIP